MSIVSYSLSFKEVNPSNGINPPKNVKTLSDCLKWANIEGVDASLLNVSEWDESNLDDMGVAERNYTMSLDLALQFYLPKSQEEFEGFPYNFNSNDVCLNPIKVYTLFHKDYFPLENPDYINNNLAEEVLFSIFVAYHNNNWYSGFIYNPNDDNSEHYYPICLRFSRKHFGKDLAIQDSIDLFLSMYDSIKFQYKDFIYTKLMADFNLKLNIDFKYLAL